MSKRCPNGTRRNKVTGECEANSQITGMPLVPGSLRSTPIPQSIDAPLSSASFDTVKNPSTMGEPVVSKVASPKASKLESQVASPVKSITMKKSSPKKTRKLSSKDIYRKSYKYPINDLNEINKIFRLNKNIHLKFNDIISVLKREIQNLHL